MQSRKKLLQAFALWDGRSDLGGLPFPSAKHAEYETLKSQFVQFYTKWGRPEVLKFIQATSHWQLAGEVYALLDEKTDDLPKFYDYINTKWKIKTSASPGKRHSDTITLKIPSCAPRTISANSPRFMELMKKLGEVGLLEGEAKINPISAKLLDDEDFAAIPSPVPAN